MKNGRFVKKEEYDKIIKESKEKQRLNKKQKIDDNKEKKNYIKQDKENKGFEKKEKIINAGFDLICQKGYYNTNTAEIAKSAGVSTGIIYQYFKDKHDILIAGVEKYASDIFYPMLNIVATKFEKKRFR